MVGDAGAAQDPPAAVVTFDWATHSLRYAGTGYPNDMRLSAAQDGTRDLLLEDATGRRAAGPGCLRATDRAVRCGEDHPDLRIEFDLGAGDDQLTTAVAASGHIRGREGRAQWNREDARSDGRRSAVAFHGGEGDDDVHGAGPGDVVHCGLGVDLVLTEDLPPRLPSGDCETVRGG